MEVKKVQVSLSKDQGLVNMLIHMPPTDVSLLQFFKLIIRSCINLPVSQDCIKHFDLQAVNM